MNFRYFISKIIKKLYIPAIKNSNIDSTSKVCSGSHLVSIEVGRYSYIGNFCTVINAKIGSFCSIADNCVIGGAKHPIDWVSTSPVFHQGKNIMKKNFSTHYYYPWEMTTIGNDVWIGNNCLIKSGVHIGNGAIIGMGSVLTKNVGEYEIWAGNPAKLIRKRFDDDTIYALLKSNWWDYDDNSIDSLSAFFNDVPSFLNKIRG